MSSLPLVLLMPLISLPSLALLLAIRRLIKGLLRRNLALRLLIRNVIHKVRRVDTLGVFLRRCDRFRFACRKWKSVRGQCECSFRQSLVWD